MVSLAVSTIAPLDLFGHPFIALHGDNAVLAGRKALASSY